MPKSMCGQRAARTVKGGTDDAGTRRHDLFSRVDSGGAGLIGSHIADRLVAEGFQEIVVLDNLTRGRRENLANASASGKVTIVDGDIRDMDLVQRAMDGIDIVFHEAAIRITHCAENPRLAHD